MFLTDDIIEYLETGDDYLIDNIKSADVDQVKSIISTLRKGMNKGLFDPNNDHIERRVDILYNYFNDSIFI